MSSRPVYTQLEEGSCRHAVELLETLWNQTEPMPGHGDPESIQDCWRSLSELVSLMAEHIEPGSSVLQPVACSEEDTDWDNLPF